AAPHRGGDPFLGPGPEWIGDRRRRRRSSRARTLRARRAKGGIAVRTAPERRLGPPPAASKGAVFIVGAGPGDAGLITVRGLSRLRVADVVLYDRLVSPALLGEAPPRAERICVGKAPGRARLDQEAIGRLMIERAASGKAVVRLKGGDPFVFGRG